jgi:hypothetical protein
MKGNFLVDFVGKCSRCGREYHSKHDAVVVCGCWTKCPLCSQEMEPYTPDLTPNTYGLDGKHNLFVLKVCNNLVGHSDHSPFYSDRKPIEVELQ